MGVTDPPLTLPDRYRFIDRLGEGATCEVLQAEDQLLQRPVALKVVRPHLAIHARFRARFAREVALSAQVAHPHVIPVHDTGLLADGRPFVSLALANSGSLGDLLQTRPPLTNALRLIDQVLDALASLHAMGLLHQDLKPANVLLHHGGDNPDTPPDAWVADLGVAGAMAELALHQRGISGTPTWMAPEQRAGHYAELGPWTDLYAVGLMLYEMLGGDRSGKSEGTRRIIESLPVGPLGLAQEVPPPLEDVVRSLLHSDPRQRYDRAADVRRAIRNAVSGTELTIRTAAPIGGHVGQSFSDVILQEGMEAITATSSVPTPSSAIQWNRVPADPMPETPPEAIHPNTEPCGLALVGIREPNLNALQGIQWLLWSKAREVVETGEPRVVLLVGAAGTGKSRTAESVARILDASGHMEATYLRYHLPAGADDGYRGAVQELLVPWNDNRDDLENRLKRWLARDQQRHTDAVQTEASVLARWCGYLEEGETPVNAAVGLAYLYRHLDARSWRGGALLVLEDAHYAQEDGDGLSICNALLDQSIGERPFLAVATLSAEAIQEDPALQARVASLEARGAIRLSVPRMSDDEMAHFLHQDMHLERTLADAVAGQVEGSPGRAIMMVRDWALRGHLVNGQNLKLSLAEGLALESVLPADIDALYHSRLQGAVESTEDPPAAYEALAATALAGQEPPIMVVREINPEGLDALISTGLVRQRGWRLVFEHGRLQWAARQIALGRPDVTELHRRLSEAWQRLNERTGADVDLPTGVHRLHSGDASGAVIPLLRAARRALDESRAALALGAARLGVAAADRAGGLSARAEARMRQAEAELNLGRPDDARRILDEARDLGKLDRRTEARIWVLLSRVSVHHGDLEAARQFLDSAAVTFEATRDRDGLIETAFGQGRVFRLAGHPNRAANCYAKMLRLNKDDHRISVRALHGLVEARIVGGRIQGIEPIVHRLREAALATGDTRRIAQATFAAGLVHLGTGDVDTAERHFHTSRALAATVGDDRLQLDSEKNLGEVYRFRGDFRSAERFYEGVVRFSNERGWNGSAAVAQLNIALVNLHRNAPRLARVAIDQADALLQNRPRHWAWLFVGLMRAMWAAEDGEEHTCRAWWAVAQERGLGRVRTQDLVTPLRQLQQAASRQGWTKIADRAAEHLTGLEELDTPSAE